MPFWVGGELGPAPIRWAGIRIMSGANTALFWSVKSLWSGMERSGMEDDNLSAEVRIKISDSKG
ncbi:MAG: hypothetical protein PHS38_13055, partial [Bacteroidales bacterium]|nr:hypothetical protein [Bacteroidales bacterium]